MNDIYGLLEKVVYNNDKSILVLSPSPGHVEHALYGRIESSLGRLKGKIDVCATDLTIYSRIRKNENALVICGVDSKEVGGNSIGVDIKDGVNILRNFERLNTPVVLLTYCMKQTPYFGGEPMGERNASLGMMVEEMDNILCSSLDKTFDHDLAYILECFLKGEMVEATIDSKFGQVGKRLQ